MKLQRYTPEIDRITSDHCRAAMVKTDAVGGYWVRDDAVETLESENAALHAECDRLTAMLGPQKPMSAEEVAVPGFYWQRPSILARFEPVWVIKPKASSLGLCMVILGDDTSEIPLTGQFIGPINMPEVSDA